MSANLAAMIDAEHPWPGLMPFTEDASAYFHGRETEAAELVRLIEREPLTVLFGQSGLGKSSLLNAGVFPRLRRAGFLPIYLRLNLDPQAPPLIDQLRHAMAAECARHEVAATRPRDGDSFWAYLHRPDTELINPHGRRVTPVFALDQFEEIFTLGRQTPEQSGRCQRFLEQLGELIENRVPPELEAELTTHPERLDEFDLLRQTLKIVFVFREDYLAEFEGLKTLIRPIMQNRMRLAPMEGHNAAAAIQRAGLGRLSEAVAGRIVRFVAGSTRHDEPPLETLKVEPALLSLVCRELNEQRIQRRETEINADLIKSDNAQHIIEMFYAHGFEGLDRKVRNFVEDRLLTAAGFRDSCALDNALAEPGINMAALETLIARRILRREERGGLVRVELIHDVLAGVAKSSRERRRAELALAEAQQQMARQRNRQRWAAFAAAVLIGLVIGVSWLAIQASHARDEALAAKTSSDLATARANDQRMRAENERLRALSAEENALHQKAAAETALRRAQSAELDALGQKQSAEAARSEGDHNLGLVLAERADRAFAERRVNAGQVYAARALARIDAARAPALRGRLRGDRLINPGVGMSILATANHELLCVAYSPDGRYLATGARQGGVQLWDMADEKPVATLDADMAQVHAIAFSPDSRTLAFGTGDGSAGIIDVGARKVTARFGERNAFFASRGEAVLSIALSPDGQVLAAGLGNGSVNLWNVGSGKIQATLQHFDEVLGIAFSPDGRLIATGSVDKSARTWEAASGKPLATMRGRDSEVHSVAISPDGRVLATGSADGSIRLSDLASGNISTVISGHQGPVTSVVFSRDGLRVASGSQDGSVRLWDAESGKPWVNLNGHNGTVHAVAINPDKPVVASVGADKTLRLWDLARGRTAYALPAHPGPVHDAIFSHDGRRVFTAAADGKVRLWAMPGGKPLGQFEGHTASVNALVPGRDGRLLVSASGDASARIWDLATGRTLVTLTGHAAPVNGVDLSPDNRVVATGSSDNSIRLWDASSGSALATLKAHLAEVWSVAFSPDGRFLASGSADQTVRIWDLATRKVAASLAGHTGGVRSVAYSADGTVIASASADSTIRLWNAKSGALIKALTGHTREACGLAFTGDGNILASGSIDGSIRLWDVGARTHLATLNGHQSGVCSLSFSRDGASLVSASEDKTARIWPISRAELVVTDWRAEAAWDEARYGLKLEGIGLVPR